MLISQLPRKLQEMAKANTTNIGSNYLTGAFTWSQSPEGHSFWCDINAGRFPEKYLEPKEIINNYQIY